MQQLNASLKASLEAWTAGAERNLELAGQYLNGRGISREAARAARLGVVGDDPSLASYAGRLSIPYVTPAGVVGLKFRTMADEEPKYLCLPNSRPLLYGVLSFQMRSAVIAITEGELDALTLTHNVGIPAVGCPGVSTWQRHHRRCFTGYERVLIFGDGDNPGREFAKRINKDLANGTVVPMPDGMDVTDLFLAEGADALRRRAGLE